MSITAKNKDKILEGMAAVLWSVAWHRRPKPSHRRSRDEMRFPKTPAAAKKAAADLYELYAANANWNAWVDEMTGTIPLDDWGEGLADAAIERRSMRAADPGLEQLRHQATLRGISIPHFEVRLTDGELTWEGDPDGSGMGEYERAWQGAGRENPPRPPSAERIVNEALFVAKTAPASDRWGTDQVWLDTVLVSAQRRWPNLSRNAIVKALLDANRNAVIDLSRNDLPVDPERRVSSEIRDPLGMTYHFIRDRGAAVTTGHGSPIVRARVWKPGDPAPRAAQRAGTGTWTQDDVIAAVPTEVRKVPESGRFGGDRVFIWDLYQQMAPRFPGLTLPAFKKALAAGKSSMAYVLARADMPGAMNREQVEKSEYQYGPNHSYTWHFVIDPTRANGRVARQNPHNHDYNSWKPNVFRQMLRNAVSSFHATKHLPEQHQYWGEIILEMAHARPTLAGDIVSPEFLREAKDAVTNRPFRSNGGVPDVMATRVKLQKLAEHGYGCDDPSCPGWAVFDTDRGFEIQRCDSCASEMPPALRLEDDELLLLPEAQQALRQAQAQADQYD